MMVVVEGGGVGEAELLLHHQLLYSSYYSNTFGLMGNLAPFGPCIMIAKLFSEIIKCSKRLTLGLLRKSLSLVLDSWKVLQLL